MIVKDKKSGIKKFIWIAAIALFVLVGAAGTAYAYWLNSEPVQKAQADAAQDAADSQNKKDFIENTNSKDGESQESDGTPPTDPSNIVISTSDESNGTLTVSVRLIGYSDGQCTLDVRNGNATDNQSAVVIFQPEYSTCAGFSVDKAKLGAGTWDIKLTVTSKGIDIVQKETVVVK